MNPGYRQAQPPQQHQQQQHQQQQQQQQNNQIPQQIIFMRRGAPRQQGETDENEVVVIIPEEVMRLFVRKVYLLGLVFILISSLVWLIISIVQFNFSKAVPVPFYVWLILAFIFMIIFQCCPQTRYIFPLNWFLVIGIVLFVTLAGACLSHLVLALVLAVGLILAGVAIVVLHLFGALCPRKALPGGICTGCLILLLLITLLVFMFLMLFLLNPVFGLVFFVIFLCLVCLTVPFHAQFINGRLQVVPYFDMLACSLTIYMDFVMIFYCIFYIYEYAGLMSKYSG